MSNKKNYILYEFNKRYNEVKCTWKERYYCKEKLIHIIASTEFYMKERRILSNLVDNLEDAIGTENKHVKIKIHGCSYEHYVEQSRFYIAKITKQGIKKVDISELKDLVAEEVKKIELKRYKSLKKEEASKRSTSFKFRSGCVPCVHKVTRHRGGYYRLPATTSHKRKEHYADDEYTFKDCKIKHLPTAYDDLVRHTDKSWKTSYKVKKQWMKNKNRHVDTVKSLNDLEIAI